MFARLANRGQRMGQGVRWLLQRIPLSVRGVWMAAFGFVFLYFYGWLQKDWILLVLGVCALCLWVLGILMVGISALWIAWRVRALEEELSGHPLRTVVGQHTPTGLRLPAWHLPFLDFQVRWVEPEAEVVMHRGFTGNEEHVVFPRRWSTHRIVREYQLRDFFWMADVRWQRVEERSVQVLPETAQQEAFHLRSMVDGDGKYVPSSPRHGDLVDTRAYMPGDPIRHIHWKLFARSQELIVRIPEPSRDYDLKLMAYLVCDPFDGYAAELARWSLETGALGHDWCFGADGVSEIARGDVASAQEILARSGLALEGHGQGLEMFLQTSGFQADQHLLLVFASGSVWRWFPQLQDTLHRFPERCSLVVADQREQHEEAPSQQSADVLEQETAAVRWRRRLVSLFLMPKPEDEPSQPELLQELRAMGRSGVDLRFVGRPHRAVYAPDFSRAKDATFWTS